MQKVAVLNYGASNIRSVVKVLAHLAGTDTEILSASRAEQLASAERIVFPGQGAIGQCMSSLSAQGFGEMLSECIRNKPFLGLCLGLQSLLDASEEDGGIAGLGIIPGKVRRFPADRQDSKGNACKIPHMGWNRVEQKQAHPLWRGIASGERFYFVHSYYVEAQRSEDIAATTDYILGFTCAIARDNLFAVQFHPEKSQDAGLQLLRNFLTWRP